MLLPNQRDNRIIRFFVDAFEDTGKSEQARRLVCTPEMEMCEVTSIDDGIKTSWVGPAHDPAFAPQRDSLLDPRNRFTRGKGMQTPAERFPDQYAAFKAGMDQHKGIPIDKLPFLSKGQVYELKALGIETVNQFAGLGDNALKGMGFSDLGKMARAWLEETDKAELTASVVAEKAALEARLAKLEAALAEKEGTAPAVPAAPVDDVDTWDADRLRAWLADKGVAMRANAAEDKMRASVRTLMEDARMLEMQAAAISGQ